MSITRFSFHSPASVYTRPISFRGSDTEEQTTNPLDRIPEPSRFFRTYQPTDKYDPKFNRRLEELRPPDKLKLLQLPNITASPKTCRRVADSLDLHRSVGEAYELSQSVFPPPDVEASSQTMRSRMKTGRNLATHEAHFKINAKDLVGKKLLLIGGGQGSLKKELTERNIDCDVTNIDPAFTSLNTDNADHLISHKFSHPETKKVLRQNQYDEVWALWSLPMYASNRHEVIDFFKDSLKAVSPKQGILRFGPTGRYEYTMDVSGMLREAYIKRLNNIILNVLEARKDLFDVQDFNVKLPNKLWMKSIRVIGEPNAATQYLEQLETNVLQHEDFIKLSTITEPRLLPSQNTEEKYNQNPWARVKKHLFSKFLGHQGTPGSQSETTGLNQLSRELQINIAEHLIAQPMKRVHRDLDALAWGNRHYQAIVNKMKTGTEYQKAMKPLLDLWNSPRSISDKPWVLFPYLPKKMRLDALRALLSRSYNYESIVDLAQNPALTKAERDQIRTTSQNFNDEKVQADVLAGLAQNPALTEAERTKICTSSQNFNQSCQAKVLAGLAKNPAVAKAERNQICISIQNFNQSCQADVLAGLAQNPALTEAERTKIHTSSQNFNQSCQMRVLAGLAQNPTLMESERNQVHTSIRDFDERTQSYVLAGLAKNPALTEAERTKIRNTIQNSDDLTQAMVLAGMAKNPKLTQAERTQIRTTSQNFSMHNQTFVLAVLAQNPALTEAERNLIHTSIHNFKEEYQAGVLASLAQNPGLSEAEQAQICTTISDFYMRNQAVVLAGLAKRLVKEMEQP